MKYREWLFALVFTLALLVAVSACLTQSVPGLRFIAVVSQLSIILAHLNILLMHWRKP